MKNAMKFTKLLSLCSSRCREEGEKKKKKCFPSSFRVRSTQHAEENTRWLHLIWRDMNVIRYRVLQQQRLSYVEYWSQKNKKIKIRGYTIRDEKFRKKFCNDITFFVHGGNQCHTRATLHKRKFAKNYTDTLLVDHVHVIPAISGDVLITHTKKRRTSEK